MEVPSHSCDLGMSFLSLGGRNLREKCIKFEFIFKSKKVTHARRFYVRKLERLCVCMHFIRNNSCSSRFKRPNVFFSKQTTGRCKNRCSRLTEENNAKKFAQTIQLNTCCQELAGLCLCQKLARRSSCVGSTDR